MKNARSIMILVLLGWLLNACITTRPVELPPMAGALMPGDYLRELV